MQRLEREMRGFGRRRRGHLCPLSPPESAPREGEPFCLRFATRNIFPPISLGFPPHFWTFCFDSTVLLSLCALSYQIGDSGERSFLIEDLQCWKDKILGSIVLAIYLYGHWLAIQSNLVIAASSAFGEVGIIAASCSIGEVFIFWNHRLAWVTKILTLRVPHQQCVVILVSLRRNDGNFIGKIRFCSNLHANWGRIELPMARARPRNFSRQFWPVLRHAISECCLIIMLVATAVLSYMATAFARMCRLRSPCMLCSRLDRFLYGKAWFSEELVCAAHRLEISRLSYCQNQSKLACSDDMCDSCLLSCTTSDGKPSNLPNMNVKEKARSRSRSRRKQLCSCCSVQFKKAPNSHRLSEVANNSFDDMNKVRSMSMASVEHSSDDDFDHLPFEGYKKLKVGHDSESEIHISDSDDDVGNAIPREAGGVTIDISSRDVQLQPMISSGNGLSMLPSDNTVMTKPKQPLNTARHADSQSSGTKVAEYLDPAIGHGLDEINWSQINANASDSNIDLQSRAMPEQVCTEHPEEKTFFVGIGEVGDSFEGVSGSPDEEAMNDCAASTNAGTSSSADTHMNHNNSLKSSSGSRGYLKSPRLSEIISARDTNSKTNEEVKTFLSQLSSARGFDGPFSEMTASPKISTQIDEYRAYDATGMAPVLDRNNSNTEPFDVNATSEDEGESSIERLKQQAEVNRKKMSMLYKELEAERSASAVAASEAMAMINRLQEEKAGMHMEALQYLRMMEEQADHDQEAIEKLNDLLTEREKELLDLEAELEGYRSRLHDKPFDVGNFNAIDGAMAFGVLDGSDFMRNTMFDFEDENAKILDSLHSLEETLGMSSINRLDLHGTNDTLQNGPSRDHLVDSHYLQNSELGTSQDPREYLISVSASSQQNDENQSVENQKSSPSCSQLDDANTCSMTSVKHDISLLNTRFKALEADQNFLKQILSSLNCSSDGMQYIQEITSHLRELRRIMAEQRDMTVL